MIQRTRLWLAVIRDAFVFLLPLTFFRVIADLLRFFPWPGYQQLMTDVFGPEWYKPIDLVTQASLGIFGLALAIGVSVELTYRLSTSSRNPAFITPMTVAVSAIINFVLVSSALYNAPMHFGVSVMLTGIAVGLATTELLYWAARRPWLNFIHVPYDTDAAFYHSIRLTPPIIFIGTALFIIVAALHALLPPLSGHLLAPVAVWANTHGVGIWLLSLIAALINQALWFVGIHGSLAMDAYFSADLFAPSGAPYSGAMAWRPIFDNFILLGGSGATLGLLIAIIIATRDGAQREIAKLSALPSLFNINDILLYGLPIILNPVYLLPFLGIPLLLTLLTVAAAQFGLVDMFSTPFVPWTTPALLSGWLVTHSWRGVALQLIEIGISTALYLPFAKRAETQRRHREAKAFANAIQAIQTADELQQPIAHRLDHVGMIARGLLADLRNARNRNALTLVYQPMHDRAGRVTGVEALLRWKHARYGMLPTEAAITLAEQSGEIRPLGLWILDQACACKARWNAAGYRDLTMAINVSPVQLTDCSLAQELTNRLQKHSLTPAEIELEITESSVIPETRTVDQTLAELTKTGVRLSMDDFGMGYSSLLYLRRFKVHAIKIDGSLTRDVLCNRANADIIRTITALGQAQQVHVIAEFVETSEQREVLAQMGCDTFQGYFHSPPLDEEQCLDYFKRQ